MYVTNIRDIDYVRKCLMKLVWPWTGHYRRCESCDWPMVRPSEIIVCA